MIVRFNKVYQLHFSRISGSAFELFHCFSTNWLSSRCEAKFTDRNFCLASRMLRFLRIFDELIANFEKSRPSSQLFKIALRFFNMKCFSNASCSFEHLQEWISSKEDVQDSQHRFPTLLPDGANNFFWLFHLRKTWTGCVDIYSPPFSFELKPCLLQLLLYSYWYCLKGFYFLNAKNLAFESFRSFS